MKSLRYPGLTERRERFVVEYLKDGNATQAAIRAGFSRNQRAAEVEGSRLLRRAEVLAALATARAARAARCDVTADWVLMQQVSLHAATVERDPEVSRKALRDIGDGIGMYVEKRELSFPQLSHDERSARIAVLLGMAQQRQLGSGGNAGVGAGDDGLDR